MTHVLAIATETGSGKAIAPVIPTLLDGACSVTAYLSRDAIAFAQRISRLDSACDLVSVESLTDVDAVLEFTRPGCVVIGTRPVPCVEREATVAAKRRGIPTVSIVDERYGFSRRFSGEEACLPDLILTMDDWCLDRAIEAGLPKCRLRATGSPILSFLASQGQALFWEDPFDQIGLTGKRVVFLSEMFARDNGTSVESPGRLSTFLGFTEDTVRADIQSVLVAKENDFCVMEKLHPSDDSDLTDETLSSGVRWKQVRDVDLWSLLASADLVIGMRSMALLESALIGTPTASYQPNLIGENRCSAVTLGLVDRLDTRDDVSEWMQRGLRGELEASKEADHPAFARADAPSLCASLILSRASGAG